MTTHSLICNDSDVIEIFFPYLDNFADFNSKGSLKKTAYFMTKKVGGPKTKTKFQKKIVFGQGVRGGVGKRQQFHKNSYLKNLVGQRY